jgi:hypothetical protein
MVIGVLIYFAYGRRHSVLARREECDFGVKTCAENARNHAQIAWRGLGDLRFLYKISHAV